mmetsp:Transcript_5619/g.20114  ORF Transcript_5619/g.20114 Transcript_5619/m.20114 type:complete len:439 (+) Transcript_5619:54-1370(+)
MGCSAPVRRRRDVRVAHPSLHLSVGVACRVEAQRAVERLVRAHAQLLQRRRLVGHVLPAPHEPLVIVRRARHRRSDGVAHARLELGERLAWIRVDLDREAAVRQLRARHVRHLLVRMLVLVGRVRRRRRTVRWRGLDEGHNRPRRCGRRSRRRKSVGVRAHLLRRVGGAAPASAKAGVLLGLPRRLGNLRLPRQLVLPRPRGRGVSLSVHRGLRRKGSHRRTRSAGARVQALVDCRAPQRVLVRHGLDRRLHQLRVVPCQALDLCCGRRRALKLVITTSRRRLRSRPVPSLLRALLLPRALVRRPLATLWCLYLATRAVEAATQAAAPEEERRAVVDDVRVAEKCGAVAEPLLRRRDTHALLEQRLHNTNRGTRRHSQRQDLVVRRRHKQLLHLLRSCRPHRRRQARPPLRSRALHAPRLRGADRAHHRGPVAIRHPR